jgi:XTP/dITP diphosphohydrolase
MPTAPRTSPILMVGTANEHKTREIATILGTLPVEVVSASRLPRRPAVAETGATFAANAALKARAFAAAAARLLPSEGRPRWVLSDDSGLCVDALGDAPGVFSARYAADAHCPEPTDEQNNRKLLDKLTGLPAAERKARFVCSVAVAAVPGSPAGQPELLLEAEGACAGVILESPRGNAGFGYDPLFLDPELGCTFAEMPPAEKNRRSHRARALLQLRAGLARLLRTC